jgi:hypothetical protein
MVFEPLLWVGRIWNDCCGPCICSVQGKDMYYFYCCVAACCSMFCSCVRNSFLRSPIPSHPSPLGEKIFLCLCFSLLTLTCYKRLSKRSQYILRLPFALLHPCFLFCFVCLFVCHCFFCIHRGTCKPLVFLARFGYNSFWINDFEAFKNLNSSSSSFGCSKPLPIIFIIVE